MSLLADALIDSISATISSSSGVMGTSRPETEEAPAPASADDGAALINGAQMMAPVEAEASASIACSLARCTWRRVGRTYLQ